MQNYHDVHGHLPPAVVYGADGTPLLSWRVLVLPYMEQSELYEKFWLNEPWDGPHNSNLLSQMPASYAAPGRKKEKMPPYHTVVKVFFGKGAAFEGRKELRMPRDFPDGTSNTILIAETGTPVPWTKPEDIPFDSDGPLPDLRGPFKNAFRACTCDGFRKDIRYSLSEQTLRAAITRNASDTLGPDW